MEKLRGNIENSGEDKNLIVHPQSYEQQTTGKRMYGK